MLLYSTSHSTSLYSQLVCMSHLTKSSEVHLAALTLPTSALLLLHLPTTRVVLRRRPRRWVRGARLHQDAVRASLCWATVLTAEVA